MKVKFFFMLLGCFLILVADEIEFKASVNARKIGSDDVLVYTITYKGIQNPPQPDISAVTDFRITQTSQSSEFRFINGVSSTFTNFIFYLMPSKTGTLTIPAISFEYQGTTFKTDPIVIQVVKGSVGSLPAPGQKRKSLFDNDFFNSPFDRPQQEEVDVKLDTWVSKQHVSKGEQVLFKVLLYTRNRIESINLISNQSFPGFWQEWYPVPRSIDGISVEKNGRVYQVYEIRKVALFPTETGVLAIPSLKFEVSLVDQAFSIFSSPRKIFRESDPVNINVFDLPPEAAGLPVGDFAFRVVSEKNEVDINDILTVKLIFQGQGNLKTLEIPEFSSNDLYKVYPAKITRKYDYGQSGLTGTLTGEVPVAFKSPGMVSLPPLEFAFYNPDMKKISRLASGSLNIRVTGNREKSESALTVGKTEIVKKGEDIDFIKKAHVPRRQKKWYRSGIFMVLCLIPFLLNVFYMLQKTVVEKIFKKNKTLHKRILINSTIKKLVNTRDHGEIHVILETYLQKKTGLGFSEIRKDNIESLFKRANVSDYDIDSFLRIKSESESSRFSPGKKSLTDLRKEVHLLVGILIRIDRKLS
jgi:hypothetical protein